MVLFGTWLKKGKNIKITVTRMTLSKSYEAIEHQIINRIGNNIFPRRKNDGKQKLRGY